MPFLRLETLFGKFRLDEPWDGPHNRALLERMPTVYALPGGRAEPGMTFYRGFSGKDALFDPTVPEGVDLTTITDGLMNTIAVVEAREAVPWTRPGTGIPYTEAMTADRTPMPLYGETRNVAEHHGHYVDPMEPEILEPLLAAMGQRYPDESVDLFCDGSVRHIPGPINRLLLRALITRSRGEVVSADAYGTARRVDSPSDRPVVPGPARVLGAAMRGPAPARAG